MAFKEDYFFKNKCEIWKCCGRGVCRAGRCVNPDVEKPHRTHRKHRFCYRKSTILSMKEEG